MEEGAEVFLGLGLISLLIGLVGFVLYILSIIWAYRDAERRGKSGILIAILVAFAAWPLGLVIWLLIRPSGYGNRYRETI
ncbi:hypothetical protein [Rufibacter tibetensis]|uniref:Cardiolipin synthase N-terminal domain-containing protein n=1 Tax=Rufibacter tibetensis TaxID=512763 RepID=A0A0P0CG51_9BACT|nr:hypothetical protein [Rufibacter tibetensis]ALJ00907.1 hypothetical protein DC20_20335 [Rufibacter tibetensis]